MLDRAQSQVCDNRSVTILTFIRPEQFNNITRNEYMCSSMIREPIQLSFQFCFHFLFTKDTAPLSLLSLNYFLQSWDVFRISNHCTMPARSPAFRPNTTPEDQNRTFVYLLSPTEREPAGRDQNKPPAQRIPLPKNLSPSKTCYTPKPQSTATHPA